MIRSCGVIPIRNDHGTLRYLLMQHKLGHHWGFPKGHVDGNESDEVTARRELREEVGITKVQLVPGYITKDRYEVRTPDGKKPKQVTYFIGLVREAKIVPQAEEVSDAHWFDYQSARLVLANPSSRRILERANVFLTTNRKYWQ